MKVYLVILFSTFYVVSSFQEQGVWNVEVTKESNDINITKSLYKNSKITLNFRCQETEAELSIKLLIASSRCTNKFLGIGHGPGDIASLQNHFISDLTVQCESEKDISIELSNGSHVFTTPEDNIYLILADVTAQTDFKIMGIVEMKGCYGYLSAIDWPLLPFAWSMTAVYVIYLVSWLLVCFLYRSDLLSAQYWIGVFILCGLLEKILVVGEYQSLNKTGQTRLVFAFGTWLVARLGTTVCRMLLLILSCGVGFVVQQSGRIAIQWKVFGIGFCHFIFSSSIVIFIAIDHDLLFLVMLLVWIVIEISILVWIFVGLRQTIRTLVAANDCAKLPRFRHFRRLIVFVLLASIGFMIWSIMAHTVPACFEDWNTLWVEAAFWDILNVTILLVIMILWRPSANYARMAFIDDTKYFQYSDYVPAITSGKEEKELLINTMYLPSSSQELDRTLDINADVDYYPLVHGKK